MPRLQEKHVGVPQPQMKKTSSDLNTRQLRGKQQHAGRGQQRQTGTSQLTITSQELEFSAEELNCLKSKKKKKCCVKKKGILTINGARAKEKKINQHFSHTNIT